MAQKRNYSRSGLRERGKRSIDRQRHPVETIQYETWSRYNAKEMYNLLREASQLARRRQLTVLRKLKYNPETGEFMNKSIPVPLGYRKTNARVSWADYDFTLSENWRYYADPRNINATRQRFREIQSFLQNESSTLQGWQRILERTASGIGEAFKIIAGDQELYNMAWQIYNAVSEQFTEEELNQLNMYGKALQEYIAQTIIDKDYSDYSVEEIATMISNDIYAARAQGFDSFADFQDSMKDYLAEFNEKRAEEGLPELTMREYKEGLLNGSIEDENEIYFISRNGF